MANTRDFFRNERISRFQQLPRALFDLFIRRLCSHLTIDSIRHRRAIRATVGVRARALCNSPPSNLPLRIYSISGLIYFCLTYFPFCSLRHLFRHTPTRCTLFSLFPPLSLFPSVSPRKSDQVIRECERRQ